MLCPSLRRCIRKIPCAVYLKCTAFYLHEIFLCTLFHVRIYSGISIHILRLYIIILLFLKPFPYHLIRCLTINIYPTGPFFIYRYQIILCFTGLIVRPLNTNGISRQQKLPTPPCIFYVYRFHPVCDLHIGDKSVRSVDKFAFHNIFILHNIYLPQISYLQYTQTIPGKLSVSNIQFIVPL